MAAASLPAQPFFNVPFRSRRSCFPHGVKAYSGALPESDGALRILEAVRLVSEVMFCLRFESRLISAILLPMNGLLWMSQRSTCPLRCSCRIHRFPALSAYIISMTALGGSIYGQGI